jgi:hypothetical protein
VEGQTEALYLKRLKELINEQANANCKVDFTIKKCERDHPLRYAKSLGLGVEEVYHCIDYEGGTEDYSKNLANILRDLIAARKEKGIKYHLCYSNLTFELWIILHKADCRSYKANQDKYLKDINNAFKIKFECLNDYKKEVNFKKLLSSITLTDIENAIKRAKDIDAYNANTYKPIKSGLSKGVFGDTYFENNPSLNFHKLVEKILKQCGLLK